MGNPRMKLEELSDGELIERYLHGGSEQAFRVLVERHYSATYSRFARQCGNPDDAADLTQQLWIRVLKNLHGYRDDDRFPAFLNRIATNLLTDYWRHKGVTGRVFKKRPGRDDTDPVELAVAPTSDPESDHELARQIRHLVKKLIPALPWEQRLVFLLRHESEYWEEKRRLEWSHLAELNGIDRETAWSRFEQARNLLVEQLHGETGSPPPKPDDEALLVFLVWTQAQRLSKQQEFTWDYFARLLNVSANTLKTRYRAAVRKLNEGLSGVG